MWKVLTPLHTVKIGRKLWMLTEEMKFQTPLGKVTVPTGFLFDHASVPRLFSNIVPPVKSCIAEASVYHDWMYCKDSEDIPRKIADKGLKYLTINKAKDSDATDKAIAKTAYMAVRIASGGLYNKQFYAEKIKHAYKQYRYFDAETLKYLFIGEL